jgi:hypothetical protein
MSLAKPHDTPHHEVCQEPPRITALVAAWQAIEAKRRAEARVYEIIACISHIDDLYHHDRELLVDFAT